ncbi:hypothetical protein MB901379_00812 [Mycobacterium basiliense]|uniref:Uncharacterized protein n=1 Tax=Mycobacterium basiliense TaxID=2094119 RepID=A0A447G9W9_9MYCO|nr:hypothetical protein MB901379_00812 [Mycobacterium basiliense]
MRVGVQPDGIVHGQHGAVAGQCVAAAGFPFGQRRRHDDRNRQPSVVAKTSRAQQRPQRRGQRVVASWPGAAGVRLDRHLRRGAAGARGGIVGVAHARGGTGHPARPAPPRPCPAWPGRGIRAVDAENCGSPVVWSDCSAILPIKGCSAAASRRHSAPQRSSGVRHSATVSTSHDRSRIRFSAASSSLNATPIKSRSFECMYVRGLSRATGKSRRQ